MMRLADFPESVGFVGALGAGGLSTALGALAIHVDPDTVTGILTGTGAALSGLAALVASMIGLRKHKEPSRPKTDDNSSHSQLIELVRRQMELQAQQSRDQMLRMEASHEESLDLARRLAHVELDRGQKSGKRNELQESPHSRQPELVVEKPRSNTVPLGATSSERSRDESSKTEPDKTSGDDWDGNPRGPFAMPIDVV